MVKIGRFWGWGSKVIILRNESSDDDVLSWKDHIIFVVRRKRLEKDETLGKTQGGFWKAGKITIFGHFAKAVARQNGQNMRFLGVNLKATKSKGNRLGSSPLLVIWTEKLLKFDCLYAKNGLKRPNIGKKRGIFNVTKETIFGHFAKAMVRQNDEDWSGKLQSFKKYGSRP